jgi:hypothetical protein
MRRQWMIGRLGENPAFYFVLASGAFGDASWYFV